MHEVELLLVLLAAIALLSGVARHLHIAYPILFVVGGLLLAVMPGVPSISLAPELVFLLFFPPLLYAAAWESSPRDLRDNLRPIGSLAVGYVLASIVLLAIAAHVIGMDWPQAFVLSTIISPTDPVAALAIIERLPVPRRAETILEGEGLFNDTVGLVTYRIAVAAAVSGAFSPAQAGVQLLVSAAGGVAIGLAIGWLLAQFTRRVEDTVTTIIFSLLTSFITWIIADTLTVSAVLAVVTAALYAGQQSAELLSARTRLRARVVWDIFTFILEGLLFILLGLELREALQALAELSWGTLLWYGFWISAAAILVRVVWTFGVRWLIRVGADLLRRKSSRVDWRTSAILAWSGMRGADSLAPALAVPVVLANDTPFPQRHLIIFLTYSVILVTLLAQGLSLPRLIRVLHVDDGDEEEREENLARLKTAEAALAALDGLAHEAGVPKDVTERMRARYQHRVRDLRNGEDQQHEARDEAVTRLAKALIDVERKQLIQLRDDEAINDDVLRTIERELDIEHLRLTDSERAVS